MYVSPTHEFKKSVFVVHTFQKMQKVLYFENFASSIAIKNIRSFANRIKWEFQINGHRLKFDELSGGPPMARLHGF